MSLDFLQSLVGTWQGTCRTWFKPDELADESPVNGQVEPVLGGLFIRHRYRGEIQGKRREGEEMIAFNAVTSEFQASWVDDFHMNYALMFSVGRAIPRGFEVIGRYDVAAGEPAWGWRTQWERLNADQLLITAWNVSPEGEETKALETRYDRAG